MLVKNRLWLECKTELEYSCPFTSYSLRYVISAPSISLFFSLANNNNIIVPITSENKEELKKRLIKRNQNTNNEVEKRFKSFDDDVKHWKDYDYVIINKNLDVCFKQIEKIISINKKNFLSFLI